MEFLCVACEYRSYYLEGKIYWNIEHENVWYAKTLIRKVGWGLSQSLG